MRPRRPDDDVERALDGLGDVHGIAFTSAAAVDFFFAALAMRFMDTRALADHVVAAATHTVAAALESRGIMNDVDLEEVRAKGFARALGDSGLLGAGRVLVPRSSAAGGGLIEQMRSEGIDPVPLVLYDPGPADLGWLAVKLEARRPDAVAFLSGSGVDAVLDAVPELGTMEPPPLWACVGGFTASALRRRGLEPDVVPERPDVDLMVEHVAKKLTSSP
jgi:uroporphyrinogen-III synthase